MREGCARRGPQERREAADRADRCGGPEKQITITPSPTNSYNHHLSPTCVRQFAWERGHRQCIRGDDSIRLTATAHRPMIRA